jgi:3-oxoacyl-[acyl-carrier-protein] synthase II
MRENYADPSEIGLIVGNTHSTYEESISCAEELGNNPDLVNPMVFANTLPNLVVSAVAQRENIQGPCVTIANQRTASLDSIGIAMQFLTDDRLKVALVGGVDMISMAKLIAFDSSELRNKKNYYLGEGAGIIMMETLEHAQERKAPHVYAEIEKYENYSNTVHSHGTNYKIGRQLGDCLSAGGILELLRLIRLNQENRVSIDYVTLRGFDFLGNRARVKLKFI